LIFSDYLGLLPDYRKLVRGEGIEKLKKEDNKKALAYKSGMMGRGWREEQQEQGGGSEKRVCKHCGNTFHSRITSLKYPQNPKNESANATPQGQ
jgi:hypothetical protein